MSLVPMGQTFEPLASPMKGGARRGSAIGLSSSGLPMKSPKKASGLNQVVQEEIEEEEDQEEEVEEAIVVDVVDTEEGDVVYLENRDSPRPKQVCRASSLASMLGESLANSPANLPERIHDAPAEPQVRHAKY